MTIRMKLKQIDTAVKTVLEKGKKMIDTNGDGVIDKQEIKEALMNPQFFKLIAISILSLLLPETISWIQESIEAGMIVPNGMLDLIKIIVVPFLMTVMFKKWLDDYASEAAKKDEKVKSLENDLINEKAGRLQDANKAEIEMLQLAGAMDLKNQEIVWIRDKFPLKNE